ncbi:quinol oxidase polypeptide II QoxA [Staphylococcus aureus]|uniref:Quinol oxidase polypeptide II QoxA n=1 Tax=Staphylococcus aureus TaxID=1280 RepID=A0A380EI54_STAAU|nr:quinol oxidase polypeptide II QoxA [Staphylococcus aureus]
MFKDVSDKPLIPARKAQITNANYKRHGMKLMILGNDEPYNNEFKKDESKNAKEMKKISKDAQDQTMMIMEVDINEFSMGSITS